MDALYGAGTAAAQKATKRATNGKKNKQLPWVQGSRSKFDLLVTSYEYAVRSPQLAKVPWACIVVDEAHRLKSPSALLYRKLEAYTFQHTILVTGTPIQNTLSELWSLLHFIDPDGFPSLEDFESEFGDGDGSADPAKIDALQKILRKYLLRREKADVETTLPERKEIIVEVALSSLQKRCYRAIFDKNAKYLNQGRKGSGDVKLGHMHMLLRHCCNHPFLLEGVEDAVRTRDGPDADVYDMYDRLARESVGSELAALPREEQDAVRVDTALVRSSGKLILLEKLLRHLKSQGRKCLVFSQFVMVLNILEDFLNLRGFKYERIDGNVTGFVRQAAIDRFSHKESESSVFLLCTRAGGVGINLTAADTVVIYDSDWNPQNDLQAMARAHRIGQTKSVTVYRLVSRNTYESELLNMAAKKLGLDRAILGNMVDSGGKKGKKDAKLTQKDMELLLKKGAYHQLGLGQSDDSKPDDFKEEQEYLSRSIEDILANATTRSAEPKQEAGGGSSFAKASFVAEE